MRARLALKHCGAHYELREVLLKDKPMQMLQVSSKGTVPVLVLTTANRDSTENGAVAKYRVIDESIDVMRWAMKENPARHVQNANAWLATDTMSKTEIEELIQENDFEFKQHLDKYKYSDRHPEHPQDHYLHLAMPFLSKLESKLSSSPYLSGSQFRFPDAAILPFIRQFSMVKPKQFASLELPHLQQWLTQALQGDLFNSIMDKQALWNPETTERVHSFVK